MWAQTKQRGKNINTQPKYILCTKSKSRHRKAIAVCHQCDDRHSCDEYQQIRQTQQARQTPQPQEFLVPRQVQEVQRVRQTGEARQMQQDMEARQPRQPDLMQALDTLVMAFNKKHIPLKEAKALKSALEELSALFKES